MSHWLHGAEPAHIDGDGRGSVVPDRSGAGDPQRRIRALAIGLAPTRAKRGHGA
jgi:hypothetical protein